MISIPNVNAEPRRLYQHQQKPHSQQLTNTISCQTKYDNTPRPKSNKRNPIIQLLHRILPAHQLQPSPQLKSPLMQIPQIPHKLKRISNFFSRLLTIHVFDNTRLRAIVIRFIRGELHPIFCGLDMVHSTFNDGIRAVDLGRVLAPHFTFVTLNYRRSEPGLVI